MIESKETNLTAERDQNLRLRVVYLSISVGLLILCLKSIAFWITGSAALKSDALESIVNVVAAVFAWGAIRFAGKPADRDHPYGHGKIEYFSAAFEGGLVSIASVLILIEGIRALIRLRGLHDLDWGLALNLAAGFTNGFLGIFLVRKGKLSQSKALEADGFHVLSDFYTTLALALGLFIGKITGWLWVDGALAIMVGLLLIHTGYKMVRESSGALLDEEDPKTLRLLIAAMNRFRPSELIAVHQMRSLRSGRFTHVHVHLVVPEFYEVRKAHDLMDIFEEEVLRDVKLEGEFHSHIDPCLRLYCKNCPVEPCPIRREPMKERKMLTLPDAVSLPPNEAHFRA